MISFTENISCYLSWNTKKEILSCFIMIDVNIFVLSYCMGLRDI